ncbi:hypothetical protein QQ045_011145 [Rhodiola kirilowii]
MKSHICPSLGLASSNSSVKIASHEERAGAEDAITDSVSAVDNAPKTKVSYVPPHLRNRGVHGVLKGLVVVHGAQRFGGGGRGWGNRNDGGGRGHGCGVLKGSLVVVVDVDVAVAGVIEMMGGLV